MKNIKRNCKNCNKPFLADKREVNRGNAIYCSLSCVTIYKNNYSSALLSKSFICKHCGNSFNSSQIAKYCSISCKAKNYRYKRRSGNFYDKQLGKIIKELPCEICNWQEASRDVHHIIPVSENGKTVIENLISLCPNHHRMVHSNLFSQDYLLKIVKSRTISSSLESLLVKIKSKEQDANLVIKETIIPPVVSEPSKSVL
jgi:hypothetical protein